MKNQKGFTLIELMVVVAIIGILATLAVPQVNKMMARAKQAEARTTLSAIFTANKAFYVEYTGYTSYFRAMAYSPEGDYRYNAGFANGVTICPANAPAAICINQTNTLAFCTANAALCRTLRGSNDALPNVDPGNGGTATAVNNAANPQSFTASASCTLYNSAVDAWSITQNKQLTHNTPLVP